MGLAFRLAALLLFATATPACTPTRPRPIAWGRESCSHCHMTLVDPRFAAESVTRTGKAIVFDDVGCLAAWVRENRAVVASSWVSNFAVPGQWLPADSAVYLQSDTLRTPMASGLAALAPGPQADSVRASLGGTLRPWPDVLAGPHQHAPATSR
jgi:copper chaperone NosL